MKQRAKTIDAALGTIHDGLVGGQNELEKGVSLSNALTSILLCKGELHDLGLEVLSNSQMLCFLLDMLCRSNFYTAKSKLSPHLYFINYD